METTTYLRQPVATAVKAHGGQHDDGMMDGMMGGMAAGMVLSWLIGLALLALLIVATIWLARRGSPESRRHEQHRESPEELLRRRYAAGEIDEEEYRRRRAGLHGGS